MDMIKLIGIGITGAMLSVLLKEYKPVFSVCIGIVTSVLIFLSVLPKIGYVLNVIDTISAQLSFHSEYIGIIIRIIGIAYLSHFGAEICRDAGQVAISQKLELAGKIIIIAASVPIFTAVLNLLIGILPA